MLITRSDLAYAIRDQHDAGITTKVLVNDKASCTALVVSTLEASLGNDFAESSETGIMHHKYLVVDQSNAGSDPLVLLGSHNWSNAAENTNDENTLIIHNQEIANWYYQEFHARYLINFLNAQVFESPVSWKVYPNPVSEQLYIESSETTQGIIRIFDIQGKTALTIPLEVAIQQGISIHQANLKPGYYTIRLEDKQASFIGKLLVN
jgi:phosphatidylserine/phosphatidylglycerophosphate/cardiolipin synthase-like enzyme